MRSLVLVAVIQSRYGVATEATQCLQVSLEEITIPEKSTLSYRVRDIIGKINTKLTEDEKPDDEEINFLSLTSLPVMKFLSVLHSTQNGASALDMEDYTTLIAYDLLTNYLTELLTEVGNATAGSELNQDLVKEIQKRIHDAQTKIAALDPKVGHKLKEKLVAHRAHGTD